MNKNLLFDQTSSDILVSACITSGAAKEDVGCFRCHSILHIVKDCPFQDHDEKQAKNQAEKQGTTEFFKSSSSKPPSNFRPQYQNYSNSKTPTREQVCIRFNSGTCRDSRCIRRHVCSNCRNTSEPLPRCYNCSLPPNIPKHQIQAQQGSMGQTFVAPPRQTTG